MLVHLVLFQKREGKTIGTFGAPQYRILDWIEAHERARRTQVDIGFHVRRHATQHKYKGLSRNNEVMCVCARHVRAERLPCLVCVYV